MEFWGVEVKAGEPFKMELYGKRALHLSLACLGEVKKDSGSEHICLFVNVNGKELVLGTLISEKLPQQSFDLVFDKDVELSHNWKNGSVFFHGYTADNDTSVETSSEDDSESHSIQESSDSSESDEDIPVVAPNGGPATEVKQEKSTEGPKVSARKDSAAGKQKVEIVEPKKDTSSEDDDDSSDDDDVTEVKQEKPAEVPKVSGGKDSAAGKQKVKIVEPKKDTSSEDDDDSSDDEMSEDDSEDDEDNKSAPDEEDGDSDEDEETPVQVKSSKKRALASASKTAVPDKKAKMITPQKTDGKKSSVHVATPYPSKQAGKTPANKPNQQTPKTEGSHSCKPCKRTFKSEVALESHNKAKHSGGK